MKTYLSTILFALPALLCAQTSGKVFEDTNRNNVFDKTEKGIAGVVVSNGIVSVVTDQSGNYSLPQNDKAKFITVSTPSSHTFVKEFYHPADRKNADFALCKIKNEPPRFIHISDVETYTHKEWIDNLKDYVRNNPTAFIALTGDICYEKGLRFNGENLTTERMGTRMVTTLGNHDLIGENHKGEAFFEKMFGPVWYSFNAGGIHFVVTPMAGGDRYPSYTKDELIEWLRSDLQYVSKKTPLVFFNHDIVFYDNDLTYRTKTDSLSLNDYNVKGWFYGHWHVNHIRQTPSGTKFVGTAAPDKGGIDHSPSAFRVVQFDKNGDFTTELRNTYVANHVVANTSKNGAVQANVYSASAPTDRVTAYVGGKPYALQQNGAWSWSGNVPTTDQPVLVEATFNNGNTIKTTANLSVSAKAPQLEWSSNNRGGNYMSAPVVCGDKILYATTDDDNTSTCGINAVNSKTGALLWHFKTDNSIRNNFAADATCVYAADIDGTIYKIDLQSGKCVKRIKPQDFVLSPNNLGVSLKEGVLYAGHGRALAAIDADTFEIIWQNKEWDGGEGTNITITVADGLLHTGSYWRGRYTHDAATGKLLWSMSEERTSFCEASATPFDGKLYFASQENIFEAEPRTGKILRKATAEAKLGTASRPVVTDEMIFIGTADKGIVAYDRKTLLKKWNFDTRPALFYSAAYSQDNEHTVEGTVTQVGDTLYFGASDGYLYAIDSATGTFIWSYNIGAPILSQVAFDNNALYVNDYSGTLYKFKLCEK